MVEIHGELHAGEATLTEVDSKNPICAEGLKSAGS